LNYRKVFIYFGCCLLRAYIIRSAVVYKKNQEDYNREYWEENVELKR